MNYKNLILNTDSYKASHFLQYPKGTEYISSYIEARGGIYDEALFYGLQAFIKEYLLEPISKSDIAEAKELLTAHGLPFNEADWHYILEEHKGYLPLEISSILEGEIVPVRNVLVQVVNTDPKCFWLTSYIETALLRAVWYPTTVATLSFHIKQIIKSYLSQTADSIEGLEFKLHDFGARGTSSFETAMLGGSAHLLNFRGTDTLSGILGLKKYYNAKDMTGFSIPASEHSTMTAWGKDNEAEAYKNMITSFGGKGKIFAVVSDSYDLFHAIDKIWGEELKEEVINNGATLVIRPDSGKPVEIVTEVLERLMEKFGYITNSKGYKELPPYLRVIQGDNISLTTIGQILEKMKEHKISAANIAFGMGGELLQKVTRNSLQFAMKASAIKQNNQWKDVYKDPITDEAKRSKRGRLALINENNQFETIRLDDLNNRKNYLAPVFKNGKLLIDQNFSEIIKRSQQ